MVDRDGYTPIAHCSQRLLDLLNLKNAIVNANERVGNKANIDNNKYFRQLKDETLFYTEQHRQSIRGDELEQQQQISNLSYAQQYKADYPVNLN